MFYIKPITNEIKLLTDFAKRLNKSKGEQIEVRRCSEETGELAEALNHASIKEQGKGTGIGLYMAKTIIERNMGGSLTVRNINGGAEFRIEV